MDLMDPGGASGYRPGRSKGPAPQKIGFIYMLKGDGGTSNTDPYGRPRTTIGSKRGRHVARNSLHLMLPVQ